MKHNRIDYTAWETGGIPAQAENHLHKWVIDNAVLAAKDMLENSQAMVATIKGRPHIQLSDHFCGKFLVRNIDIVDVVQDEAMACGTNGIEFAEDLVRRLERMIEKAKRQV